VTNNQPAQHTNSQVTNNQPAQHTNSQVTNNTSSTTYQHKEQSKKTQDLKN
jgi:hypothetical protein